MWFATAAKLRSKVQAGLSSSSKHSTPLSYTNGHTSNGHSSNHAHVHGASINNTSSTNANGASNGTTNGSNTTNGSTTNVSSTSNCNTNGRNNRKYKTLKDRSQVPLSFYVSVFLLFLHAHVNGIFHSPHKIFQQLYSSILTSYQQSISLSQQLIHLLIDTFYHQHIHTTSEYMTAMGYTIVASSFLYLFIYSPFKAGMWTGKRATRQILHRYMGLAFLIQYILAWVEFLTNYEHGYQYSYLPYTIALNGIIQAQSAYFYFRVIPDLQDPGFYNEKGTVSRLFIHENTFFQLIIVFGSLYYIDSARTTMQSSFIGKLFEHTYVFWLYVIYRPFFPITKMSLAGTNINARTTQNKSWFEITTITVKIFYLWAKYFLGFFITFSVFLDITNPTEMKFIRGLFLLNVGTISLLMFLNTLRFRKVFPAKLTFSVYLGQIYATFSAIPCLYNLYASHMKLAALCTLGLLCNLTRSKKMHALWCGLSAFLLTCTDIEW